MDSLVVPDSLGQQMNNDGDGSLQSPLFRHRSASTAKAPLRASSASALPPANEPRAAKPYADPHTTNLQRRPSNRQRMTVNEIDRTSPLDGGK